MPLLRVEDGGAKLSAEEWATGVSHQRLYRVAHRRATTRQLRLYMVACCRLHSDLFFDPRIEQALAAAEKCAGDPEAEAAMDAAWHRMITSRFSPRATAATPAVVMGGVAAAVEAAWRLLDEWWERGEYEYRDARAALAHAVYLSLREHPGQVFTGGAGDAAEYCAYAVEWAEALRHPGAAVEDVARGEVAIGARMADLLRDIFGNPFRPALSFAQWRTAAVVGLARAIYLDRTFDLLPILADALEDAGCAEDAILGHCRGPGPHVRGCWVVDACSPVPVES